MRSASEVMTGDKAEFFTCVSRLGYVQFRKQGQPQPIWYNACAEPRADTRGLLCNKRVDESGVCPSCGRQGKVQSKLLARCRYVDYGDAAWLTTFHEAAQKVIDLTAEEVKQLEEQGGGAEAVENALKQKYF